MAENKIKSQKSVKSKDEERGNKRRKPMVIKSWDREAAKDRRTEQGKAIVTPVMINVSGAPVLAAVQELQEEFKDEQQELEENCAGCRLRADGSKCILCKLEDDKMENSKANISVLDISKEEVESAGFESAGTSR